MTEAQSDAIHKVEEILREHFESHVLVCEIEEEEDVSVRANVSYSGGFHNALGLLAAGEHYLIRGKLDE